jgi:CRISPR-associated protein Csx17
VSLQLHELKGCAPAPLANYLKALGVLRLVVEQEADPEARGWWQDERFRLLTKLTRDELEQFFLHRYAPTPLLSPWNKGCGFLRQLPHDWESHYGHRPLLLETLVDGNRFRGTCYRAANWIHVGQTAGRGRMDREHKVHSQAVKDIYIYPLVRDARKQLCGDLTR